MFDSKRHHMLYEPSDHGDDFNTYLNIETVMEEWFVISENVNLHECFCRSITLLSRWTGALLKPHNIPHCVGVCEGCGVVCGCGGCVVGVGCMGCECVNVWFFLHRFVLFCFKNGLLLVVGVHEFILYRHSLFPFCRKISWIFQTSLE